MMPARLILLALLLPASAAAQWAVRYTPNPSQSVYCIRFADEATGYHAGVLYNGSTFNIHKTTNGGSTYVQQSSGFTAQRFMSVFFFHPDTVYMSGNGGRIVRTDNGGQRWDSLRTGTDAQLWGLWFVDRSTGFAAGSAGTVIKTTDGGITWFPTPTNQITALDGIWFVDARTGYVGGANVIIKTTDQGASWTAKPASFISPFETAGAIYFKDAATGVYATNAGRIVRTTDGGDSWTEVYAQAGGGAVWGLSFPDTLTGYGCTNTGKVVKTTDGGITWSVQSTPLTENLYDISFPTRSIGYVASWSGKILKTTNGGATFVEWRGNGQPQQYSLEQNHPNPFNPHTTIRYALPLRSAVTLSVYDMLGREVEVLVRAPVEAGVHEVRFDGSGLPSGVYLCRLTAGEFVQTRKLMLLK